MGKYVFEAVGESVYGETTFIKIFDNFDDANNYCDKTDYQWESYFVIPWEEYFYNSH